MFLNPLLVAVLAGLPALAFQQPTPPAQQQSGQPQPHQSDPSSQQRTAHTGTGHMNKDEGKFVHKAMKGGKSEVALASMAGQRASSAEVKSFAQRLVTDHTKANQELTDLASRKGLDTTMAKPENADKDRDKGNTDQAMTDKMSNLSGESFDRAFMEHQVRHHQQEVKEFERMAAQAKDPEVRAFAAKTVPVLKEHLEQARSISGRVGAATSGKSGRDDKRNN